MVNQTTYVDLVTKTGGTAGLTGTATNLNLNSKAKNLLALLVTGCDTVITTAEGSSGMVQIVSPSLGLADQRLLTGPYISSGPATNSSGQGMVVDIFPFESNPHPQGNELISFDAGTSGGTNTTGKAYLIAIMYCQDMPPPYWRNQFPLPMTMRGGYVAEATQTTTAATALAAISIPSWVTEMIATRAVDTKSAAITTAQYQQGYFNLLSTIPDVAPLKIITNSEGSSLGTPVGTGQYNDWNPFIPIYVRNPGGTQTITPQINLTAAVTTGNMVSFGIYWR